jgi:predicted CXXCH cytochrome family protein
MVRTAVWIVGISLFFSWSAGAAEIDCLQCHEDLTKGKSVHAAVSMGCTTCHSAVDARDIPHTIKNKIARGLSSAQPGLCYDCHDSSSFKKKEIHGALGLGCTICHNPHSSRQDKLLRAALPDVCYACHDSAPFTRKHVHPPVAGGQCTTCHFPHASDTASLLQQPAPELCAMCHDDRSSGRHILAGYGLGDRHPAGGIPDPSAPGKTISCVSCHTPHSSIGRYLFIDKASKSGNLCLECHRKIIVRP